MASFNGGLVGHLTSQPSAWKGGERLLEKAFVCLGFIFGVLFILITPPFQVADESRHFVRAYYFSETIIASAGLIPRQEHLPASLVQAVREMEPMRRNATVKATIAQTIKLLTPELKAAERASYGETADYSIVSYLPQLVLIVPLRLAKVNAVVTLYVTRLFSLLFWMAATLWAIRKISVAKHLFVFIALLPMTIYQAGAMSADSITLSLSFMLVAYYLHLAYRVAAVTSRELWIVGTIGVLLSAAKLVYTPLIALHFLIQPTKFRSYTMYLLSFGLTVLACSAVIVLAYSNFLTHMLSPHITGQNQEQIGLTSYPQLNFLLENPVNWVRMFWTTGSRYGRAYMDTFVSSLGWSGAALPSYLYVITVVMLWLTAITDNSALLIRSRHKVVLAGIVVGVTIMIFVALCADTSLNGKPTLLMQGIQGRYFTPIAPLVGLLAANHSLFRQRYGRYIQVAMIPFIVFLLTNAVYFLVTHYYAV